ncbi:MAG: hypothetical protein Q9173_007212 [Seirophora scorigena]
METETQRKKLHGTQPRQPWTFHAYTLWLFTRSDLKTVVAPTVTFALRCALAAAAEPDPTNNNNNDLRDGGGGCLVKRIPIAVLWTWATLLMENIANQRLPHCILEDNINKPWRPIAAKRITAQRSRNLLLYVVPLTGLLSWVVGVTREFAALAIFTWLYNDLGGSGEVWHVRNALNAVALCTFFAGATAIVLDCGGRSERLTERTWRWVAAVGGVIVMTVQVQDLAGMDGDAACGRRTMPLIFGKRVTRWLTAVLIVARSFVCPGIWRVDVSTYSAPATVGGLLAVRVVYCRKMAADRQS